MSNENNQKKQGMSRTLLLILHCWKGKPLNDVAPVVFEHVGDKRKLVIFKLPDNFDVALPANLWGPTLAEIRNKYVAALALDEKDRLDLKVL